MADEPMPASDGLDQPPPKPGTLDRDLQELERFIAKSAKPRRKAPKR